MDPLPAPPPAAAPVFCSLIPREILELARFEPIELRPPEEPDRSGGHECALCENICSWTRHLVGRLETTHFPVIVVPASCDAMVKLHDALVQRRTASRVFRLDVPRRADPAGVRYLARQYASLAEALGVTDADVEQARARRSACPPPAPSLSAGSPPGAPRIGLAGSVFPEALFHETLRNAGAHVDTLRRCGMRLPAILPAELFEAGLDGFCERLAAHYLEAAVCPRMMGSGFADFVAREVAARRLTALVVPVLKFCDGYHLAVDALVKRLPVGFPVLLVEGDLTAGFGEQTVTRLEAFVERIQNEDGDRARRAAPQADRRLVVGVDVGSTQVKAVMMAGSRLACTFIRPTTGRMVEASAEAVAQLLQRAGARREDVATVGVTGYGRKSVASDAVATEISCHARGVSRSLGQPATVIDVGGQDSKVIVIDGAGRVQRFTMNDKCAAGTGRFIDAMVRALDLDFARFSALSLAAPAEVPVTSMCSVFAESEVISLTARGEPMSGIARGINASIARRVAGMVRRVEGHPPFVLTGGVSQIRGFVRELEREIGSDVHVLEHALYAGAIGAATLAAEGLP